MNIKLERSPILLIKLPVFFLGLIIWALLLLVGVKWTPGPFWTDLE